MSRQGLQDVRAGLSERDMAVIRSVADHRFLTTRHIEQLHFSSLSTPLSAARTCRRVLKRLESLRLVQHLDRRVGGVRAGSASFIWTLAPLGDRLLRLEIGTVTRQRQHEPSQRFLAHALAIADNHLALVNAHRLATLELIEVQTEPSCWRRYHGQAGEAAVLQPDLYAVTAPKLAGGPAAFEDCWFIEVDLGNEHLPTILRKCVQYETYRRTGIEQRDSGVFPRVVWIMSSQARVERLLDALEAARTLDATLFEVTTPDTFVALVAGGSL